MIEPTKSVLLIGFDPRHLEIIREALGSAELVSLGYDMEMLLERPPARPTLVLCGQKIDHPKQLFEAAQGLRMVYPESPIFFAGEASGLYDRKGLIRDGFTDVFLLPLDLELLNRAIQELLTSTGRKTYRSVNLIDISPDSQLEFDTYLFLPLNRKHVMFSESGSQLTEERYRRLKKSKAGSLFVSTDQLKLFYDYAANRLRRLQSDETVSETERVERMKAAVRELVGSLFSDESTSTNAGREVLENLQKIISSFMAASEKGSWYQRLSSVSADGADSYSHAKNVATYASLFALALGNKNVEDTAIAGLLHDIGLARVPTDILQKDPSKWTADERALYEAHPEYTISIIVDRKLTVSNLVHKIILQHHEHFDAGGFPKRIPGSRMCVEAKIIAIADHFDELMKVEGGKPRMTPREALVELKRMGATKIDNIMFDPDTLNQILSLFPEQTESTSELK